MYNVHLKYVDTFTTSQYKASFLNIFLPTTMEGFSHFDVTAMFNKTLHRLLFM